MGPRIAVGRMCHGLAVRSPCHSDIAVLRVALEVVLGAEVNLRIGVLDDIAICRRVRVPDGVASNH
jgi:hypothetical protein